MAVRFTKRQIDSLLNHVNGLGNSSPTDSMLYSGFSFHHHPMDEDNVYLRYREKGYDGGILVTRVQYVSVKRSGEVVYCTHLLEQTIQNKQFIYDMEEFVIDNGRVKFK
jgi:hypothetical protein